ncbi:hypothetical protein PRZ48_009292 [Zasmidium cellare]|uniref:BTB domain-containing protein n=1 Tax=Zasmidium cellare TaxID=395010 RepID=A0ABR0EBB9_ZASCE|nr:hypothetical protein PRZ48_009292 [Zasmidium cellare]
MSSADTIFDIVEPALMQLRKSGELSDFTIVSASGREWKVHKLVLFMYSDVLHRMSASTDFIEGQNGRVRLKDVEERAIEGLVRYMYCEVSNVSAADVGIDQDEFPRYCTELLEIADMYNVKGMDEYAMDMFNHWAFHDSFHSGNPQWVRKVVELTCKAEVAEGMWKLLVIKLTNVLTRDHSFDWEYVRELLALHSKLGEHVTMEFASRRFCRSNPLS